MGFGNGIPRRKVFISFYGEDRYEVDQFLAVCDQDEVFIHRALGAYDNDDFIDSTNPEYVMSEIRRTYLADSTVTIVLIGRCTHSRRYVDWELKASLRQGDLYVPNGLLGILLPSAARTRPVYLPPRLAENLDADERQCYARIYEYPESTAEVVDWIEDAFEARSARAHLIENTQDMMRNNAICRHCDRTHPAG